MARKRARKVKGLLNKEENVYDAEYIVSQRNCLNTGAIEYCVKWKGYPHYHNTWEPAANILDPVLLHEFRLRLAEGSIVDLDTTGNGDRDNNANNNNTSGQQDTTTTGSTTGHGQITKPLKGILKKTSSFGSGRGRKRKVDDQKGEGQGPKKKVKGGAAQPKKEEEENEVTIEVKATSEVKSTMTRRPRYTLASGPAYWEL